MGGGLLQSVGDLCLSVRPSVHRKSNGAVGVVLLSQFLTRITEVPVAHAQLARINSSRVALVLLRAVPNAAHQLTGKDWAARVLHSSAFILIAAVEIIGQTLTTDVWTSYDDPMSELIF